MPADPHTRLARATRFFARLVSFDLECPRCGTVYTVRVNASNGGKWDTDTGRFTCTKADCARTYLLGILAWPVGTRGGSQPPDDQVPSIRQLAQLRAEGGGWWMADDDKQRWPKPLETNLTTEEDRPDDLDD